MAEQTEQEKTHVQAIRAMASDHPDDAIRFLCSSIASGYRCALVLLTDIIDGASRPLGALMAIREDGHYIGLVSGGCVEASLVTEACSAIDEGCDRQSRYGKGSPWFDIVLPCRGGIGLHIHVVRDNHPLGDFLGLREQRRAATLFYDTRTESLVCKAVYAPTGWEGPVFMAGFRPDPQIILFGDGLESVFLVSLAEAAQVRVIRNDIEAVCLHAKDQETAIIILHHDPDLEIPVLEAALQTNAFFIGCLGSRKTQQRRLSRLRNKGHDAAQLARIHGPIGLFGPSREARSVAISVLAELFALIEARKTGSS
ncbi:XdhC family protein [Asaia krungthepensis]|nr:XdhC family protein [Asaia krungthepensis]